jgi:hypothetical protein
VYFCVAKKSFVLVDSVEPLDNTFGTKFTQNDLPRPFSSCVDEFGIPRHRGSISPLRWRRLSNPASSLPTLWQSTFPFYPIHLFLRNNLNLNSYSSLLFPSFKRSNRQLQIGPRLNPITMSSKRYNLEFFYDVSSQTYVKLEGFVPNHLSYH